MAVSLANTNGGEGHAKNCYSPGGDGELYAYLPPGHPGTDYTLLAVPPYSAQNSDYGFSVGRRSWTFEAGRWTQVTQHVRLNGPGMEDGSIHIYIDGQPVIQADNISIRDLASSTFDGVHFQTFFGGK